MTHDVSVSGGTDTTLLHLDRRGEVAVLRMQRGKVNALDLELLLAVAEAMEQLTDVAVVLTGAGSCFSAGVDLRRIVDGDAEHTDTFLTALSRALLAVFRHPRPVVAALNGHAIAGGAALAAAADVRLMSGGSVGLTELRVGVPFPTAALEIVRYAVGPAAHPLALFAELHDPRQAKALGLVHDVCGPERLLEDALGWADRLAAVTTAAYALTKLQLHAPAEARIAERTEQDDAEVHRLWKCAEGRAAIAAFLAGLDKAAVSRGASSRVAG